MKNRFNIGEFKKIEKEVTDFRVYFENFRGFC